MILDQISAAQRARKLEADSFIYTATWAPLAGSASTVVNVPIQSDSDFLMIKTHLVAYSGAGVLLVDPDLLISFFDTGSGRSFQDAAVHVHNNMGFDAFHCFYWPEPKLVKGGSVLSITLTNNTAVAVGRVDVALAGFKIFYYPGYSRDLIGTV